MNFAVLSDLLRLDCSVPITPVVVSLCTGDTVKSRNKSSWTSPFGSFKRRFSVSVSSYTRISSEQAIWFSISG